MKSYFLLLRLNLRNLLAGFRGAMRKPNGKIDISRLILYPLAVLGMLTLAGFVIFMEFSMFSAFEMLNAPEMLPGLAILLAMVTALLFSVFQMLAALYFSRDTASMAYLPLTSRTVLAAKWTEVYVSELLFSLLIAAPAVVLYGIHYAADWTYYLRMVPVLLAVNCIPLTISLLLASILGRFTSLTRHKEVWVVLGTVLMLVVVLGLEWSILPKIPEDADAAFFAQMLTGVQPMLRAFIHAFPPVAWAVDGIAGDWLQWLAFLAVSIGGVALAIALVGGSYLDTTLRQNEGSRKARRIRVTDKTFRAHSPFMAIYRREWNEILKVPVYLLNGVLGAMMLPIMLIGMSVGMSSEQDSEVSWNYLLRLMQDSVSPMDVMLILTALLMFISWVNPIIATAISREGGRMPIAKYIPVSPRTQLWAKLSVSLTINGADGHCRRRTAGDALSGRCAGRGRAGESVQPRDGLHRADYRRIAPDSALADRAAGDEAEHESDDLYARCAAGGADSGGRRGRHDDPVHRRAGHGSPVDAHALRRGTRGRAAQCGCGAADGGGSGRIYSNFAQGR